MESMIARGSFCAADNAFTAVSMPEIHTQLSLLATVKGIPTV